MTSTCGAIVIAVVMSSARGREDGKIYPRRERKGSSFRDCPISLDFFYASAGHSRVCVIYPSYLMNVIRMIPQHTIHHVTFI